MKKLILLSLLVLLPSIAQGQTNPCTAPATTTTYNPNTIFMSISDYNTNIPGTTQPVFTELQIGIFANGVNPAVGNPIQTMTVPRANVTLVAGTPDCYQATPNVLLTLPQSATLQFISVKLRRTTPDVAESVWSEASNPFVMLGVLSAPKSVRVLAR